jgi:Xaa-Pro aminopeptidase
MDTRLRIAGLRATLHRDDVAAIVVRDSANLAYITGFDGVWDTEPSSLAMVTTHRALVITDSRFAEAATDAADGGPWEVVVPAADMWQPVFSAIESGGALAIEASQPWSLVQGVTEKCPVAVRAVSGWVEALREVKDAAEIERIAAAQALTDDGFRMILERLAVGRTEREIALELEVYLRENGSEGVAFDSIVASGPNSALPHAHPTERAIRPGDFVKLDFGARIGGYCADMTRTVVVGSPSDEQRAIHEAVRAANLAGLTAVAAGRTGAEVDAAARAVISAAGYGDRFGHGLGHGVGLEVHEAPSVSARGTDPLKAGAVVTIEPGVYVPGLGGVRIEDLVVVEEGGCRNLTRSPKDLIEV